ncbi:MULTISPECIES: hypothetical protein [unclassified Rhizobium]|nr:MULTISPECIES: hypothetical protein [unclassified Rhizobium]
MRGATGPNCLFFGDQHEATNYLYREEIANSQKMRLADETHEAVPVGC